MIVSGSIIGAGSVKRYLTNSHWYLLSAPANQTVRSFIAENLNIPYRATDIAHPSTTKTDKYGFLLKEMLMV